MLSIRNPRYLDGRSLCHLPPKTIHPKPVPLWIHRQSSIHPSLPPLGGALDGYIGGGTAENAVSLKSQIAG